MENNNEFISINDLKNLDELNIEYNDIFYMNGGYKHDRK